MGASQATPIAVAAQNGWITPADDIVIGKDILELLSSAMYVDAMSIYREYIQNAADSIDEARQKSVLSPQELGRVVIDIDLPSRTVRIRDNGIGIPSRTFVRRLTSLGASAKRGVSARGFRGVGRLAGLGYCQELVFRTRAPGETATSELRWDCRQLKAALQAPEITADVCNLVRSVVAHRKVQVQDHPSHFFEVELKGIIRHKNDRLLSQEAIADYLSQVAPVPFSSECKFAPEISAALRPLVSLGDLIITVGDIAGPVLRPFRSQLDLGDGILDEFTDLQVHHLPGLDGDVAAICWILHHGYTGAIPQSSLVKGLRLRVGNIQVGDHALLDELFTETRFNAWTVGEIHVLDKRIVPNGRRDHFEQNAHYNNLLTQLVPIARDISKRCRTSSIKRKWLRDFETHYTVAKEKIDIISQGSLPLPQRKELARGAERAIATLEKIAHMDELDLGADPSLAPRVRAIQGKLNKALGMSLADSPLADLPKAKRKMYEQFFSLIYECSANRVAAKSLVDRILQKVT
jgi:hypothetical protein